ncbi:caM kinase-like vesicle-associated, like [Amia ocellicauda]|uniref:caM kinase-like vesicle-associated, like n=1 Tax=Amia ocellicauda TaxID=2972642 RepID=UPI0034639CA2
MPFGCLAIRDGRNYNSLSEITDKYEIGQILRAKEFCELCLAKERQTDKVFICKKFLKKDGRKVRKAAKNEIMILKMVNHPNILQLIDTFETRKEYYIIQELATGGDVFDWILDQGNYTERDAANVIRQVLEAVAYLHSLNIVHRNLKLENLMYYNQNNHNKVVLRDFYLSRFENGSITEPCGTPEYLAPEVVARHRYGRPVDCWAVGVITYILLSGNPPFYDETEEENTDLHNRIIFCRIVSGEFEFDSPYWDDISPAAKELVCRLMEVDPMLRITAQDALWHEWIAGNGASEKNLKDGVCAQFEKNFAKAKWRKAIRVTTFMQRLRAPEAGGVGVGGGEGGGRLPVTPRTSMSVSHEVTVENRPEEEDAQREGGKKERGTATIPSSLSVGISPTSTPDPQLEQTGLPSGKLGEDLEKGGGGKSPWKMAANLGPEKPRLQPEKPSLSPVTETKKIPDRGTKVIILEQTASPGDKKVGASTETPSRRKMAAVLSHSVDKTGDPEKKTAGEATNRGAADDKRAKAEKSWCQTQVPETVAEKRVPVCAEGRRGGGGSAEASPGWKTSQAAGGRSPEPGTPRKGMEELGAARGSPGTGRKKTVTIQEQSEASCLFGASASSSCSPATSTLGRGDWQMDSVIEQIEKQMAAVLEKIEGDMPSLLEQISDRPDCLRSHPSPARGTQTTPRPTLPHLTIQPPSAPPPTPPGPGQEDDGEREEQEGGVRSSQSPRGGVSGRGL